MNASQEVILPPMTVARWCRQLRRSRQCTLAMVSQKTNLSIAYLNQLEKGVKKNPSFRVRHALAAFYRTPFPSRPDATSTGRRTKGS